MCYELAFDWTLIIQCIPASNYKYYAWKQLIYVIVDFFEILIRLWCFDFLFRVLCVLWCFSPLSLRTFIEFSKFQFCFSFFPECTTLYFTFLWPISWLHFWLFCPRSFGLSPFPTSTGGRPSARWSSSVKWSGPISAPTFSSWQRSTGKD